MNAAMTYLRSNGIDGPWRARARHALAARAYVRTPHAARMHADAERFLFAFWYYWNVTKFIRDDQPALKLPAQTRTDTQTHARSLSSLSPSLPPSLSPSLPSLPPPLPPPPLSLSALSVCLLSPPPPLSLLPPSLS